MNSDQAIAELERELEKLEKLADSCDRQILLIKEATTALNNTRSRVDEILDHNSTAYRIFDRMSREHTLYWESTRSNYVSKNNCSHINIWVEILRATINELEPEFLREERKEKTQYFIQDGDKYRAKKIIFQIMKRAVNELIIVDQYLDETIFDYIESLELNVDIKLLTGSKKPIFPKMLKSYLLKRSNVEAKESSSCHDRFLILDQTEVWHLGASINHAGKKAFMVNKVLDSNEKNDFLQNFKNWWNTGSVVA